MTNLEKLRAVCREKKLDGAVLFDPREIKCLTGVWAGEGCAVIGADVAVIAREGEASGSAGVPVEEYGAFSWERVEDAARNRRRLLRRRMAGMGRIGVAGETCPLWLAEENWELVDIGAELRSILLCRDSLFFGEIGRALALNRAACDTLRRGIRPGSTGYDLWGAVSRAYMEQAGGPVPFQGDFLVGPECAGISGGPTGRPLEPGETVIADLLPSLEGLCCDTTRTFFSSPPDREQRRAYEAVRTALRRGEALLRPGVAAGAVYREVSGALEAEGFAPLPHHAGHGVGGSRYEAPYFIPDCDMELREDMMVTLEPGVYRAGRFGIRLENNYRITRDGCVELFRYPEEIDRFILE